MNDEFDENESAVEGENVANDGDKSISADLIRGHINTIILRSLSDSDKYGYEIIAEIEKKSRGQYSLKQPSLYSALKRLEAQGFISSYWGGTAGGGRRKYFSLTENGKAIADQNRSEWEYSRTIIDSLISDKDFDFSNPAPSAVNMRVLKETTSRTPFRESAAIESERENLQLKELETHYYELLAEKERIQSELVQCREREEYYRTESFTSPAAELTENEREHYQNVIRGKDEIIGNMDAHYEELLAKEKREAQVRERERYEEILNECKREQNELLENVRAQYEALIQSEEGQLTGEERERYEEMLREQKEKFEQELNEQAALYREREKEIRHQNYINLINTPPAAEKASDEFAHHTPRVADETETGGENLGENFDENFNGGLDAEPRESSANDYRSVVNKLYESSIRTNKQTKTKANDSRPLDTDAVDARPLDGIDFRDIEMKAAQEGIKIITSSKSDKRNKAGSSASVVHKGKALFLSALILFFACVAEGAIVMGLKKTYGIPIAYPCVLWGIGLIVLLVTGLAYANHYGEQSLRKSTSALVNSLVLYALSIILTLIVALSANIDFRSKNAIACFVVIPVVYLFGIVLFGIAYYLQIKPRK